MLSASSRCSAILPTSVAGNDGAPKLLGGTGQDKTHLLIVCTAERGLCGAFNSQIVRLAREHINRCSPTAKRSKFSASAARAPISFAASTRS